LSISKVRCRFIAKWLQTQNSSGLSAATSGENSEATVTLSTSLGKYRDLVLAIALFLILDIAVMGFNMMASLEIQHDAAEINSAGDLRALSQQLAKALLTLERELTLGLPNETSVAQVFESSDQFEQTLRGLQQAGRSRFAALVADGAAWDERRRLVDQLAAEWAPLGRDVGALLDKKDSLAASDVVPVANKSTSRNVKLLQGADDLSQQLEDIARAKAFQMRVIQVIAIALALANFIFIIFKFVRQLSVSDHRTEVAREETKQILGTVREGLFLLNRDGSIGTQRSTSMDRLFGAAVPAQAHFLDDVLKPILHKSEQLETAKGYVDMLFNKKVKSALMAKLNPLVEIEVEGPPDPRRGPRQRFLTFEFDQVKKGDEVDALLVSIFDVSQKVLLERELAEVEGRAKTEVELLLGVVDQDPALVGAFIEGAQERIDSINHELQSVSADTQSYGQVINLVARNVHWIKGEASLLRIGTVEAYAHEFEDILANLRGRRNLSGDDLIPVAVGVNELLDRINRVSTIVQRVARFAVTTSLPVSTPTEPLTAVIAAIEHLTAKVSDDLNKKVRLQVDVPSVNTVPEQLLRVCQEVLPQLIRNAVVHGIEHDDERAGRGKDAVGQIHIRIDLEGATGFRVHVRDDGRGISLPAVRNRAIEKGWHTADEAQSLPDHRVLSLIFEPGFSTADSAHLHGGRGDGLAVVREVLATVGARLRVLSRPQFYTEFVIYRPA
jgi:two-component system chemotaxis sensor kinase CheA